jgi:hypothetical protein
MDFTLSLPRSITPATAIGPLTRIRRVGSATDHTYQPIFPIHRKQSASAPVKDPKRPRLGRKILGENNNRALSSAPWPPVYPIRQHRVNITV